MYDRLLRQELHLVIHTLSTLRRPLGVRGSQAPYSLMSLAELEIENLEMSFRKLTAIVPAKTSYRSKVKKT